MKKLMIFLLAAMMLAAALAGCTAKGTEPSPKPNNHGKDAAKITAKPAEPDKTGGISSIENIIIDNGKYRFWDSFTDGSGNNKIGAVTCRIYTNLEDLKRDHEKAWRDYSEHYNEKTFENSFVVLITKTVGTGGYRYGVNSAEVLKDSVIIDLSEDSPGPGVAVTMAIEEHCILVAFPKDCYKDGLTFRLSIEGKEITIDQGAVAE